MEDLNNSTNNIEMSVEQAIDFLRSYIERTKKDTDGSGRRTWYLLRCIVKFPGRKL